MKNADVSIRHATHSSANINPSVLIAAAAAVREKHFFMTMEKRRGGIGPLGLGMKRKSLEMQLQA